MPEITAKNWDRITPARQVLLSPLAEKEPEAEYFFTPTDQWQRHASCWTPKPSVLLSLLYHFPILFLATQLPTYML